MKHVLVIRIVFPTIRQLVILLTLCGTALMHWSTEGGQIGSVTPDVLGIQLTQMCGANGEYHCLNVVDTG